MYEFDKWDYVYPAEFADEPAVPGKRQKKKGYDATPTFELDLYRLLAVSYTLSHLDVLQNPSSGERCEDCGEKAGSLRACDAAFPSNLAFSWPEDGGANGKQLSCKRAGICGDCDTKTEGTYWYCRRCRSGPTTHEDVWGFDIDEPRVLRTEGTLWALSAPSAGADELEHPADVWRRQQLERAESIREGVLRFGRKSRQSDLLIKTAAKFVSEARLRHMSKGNQQAMLDVIHALHDQCGLVEGVDGELLLPRTLDAATARADAALTSDADVPVYKSTFCMSALLQTTQTVSVLTGDVAGILQEMLLHPRIAPESLFIETRGDDPRVYCDENGNKLSGPEPWHTERHRNLMATVPNGAKVLMVGLHTDGVHTSAGSKYPFSISIENFTGAERPGERGLCKAGLAGNVDIRKPRGSQVSEKLNDRQKSLKYNLLAREAAELLARLNALAGTAVRFLVPRRNQSGGIDFVEESMYIRVWGWRADMAEQQALLGVYKDSCTNGFCFEHATADGKGGVGSKNRPHMSLLVGDSCATAQLRDVEGTSRRQKEAMRVVWDEGLEAGRARARALGVRLDVQGHLARLCYLFPHIDRGQFGAFNPDTLHTLLTGILSKHARVLDALMLRYHAKLATFKSNEDVHNLVDERLVSMGVRYGCPSFRRSFWGNGDIGSLKGHQVLALVECLPFTFAGCKMLIADDGVRRDALSLTDALCRLTRELKTSQFYSDADLDALETQVTQIFALMHRAMDHLLVEGGDGGGGKKKKKAAAAGPAAPVVPGKEDSSGPGHGYDIPKAHSLTGLRSTFLRFGFSGNMDTEAGEHSMKGLQAEARSAPRVNTGGVFVDPDDVGHTDPLLAKLIAFDAMGAARQTSSGGRAPRGFNGRVPQPSAANRSVVGEGTRWISLLFGLRKGTNGPPVPNDTLRGVSAFLTARFPAAFAAASGAAAGRGAASSASASSSSAASDFWYHPDVPVEATNRDVAYHIFLSGHCVRTKSGTFAQLILPVVASSLAQLSAPRGRLALVYEFVPCDPSAPTYPELPVPWLVRGSLNFVPTDSLAARAAVVPLFGNALRSPRDLRDQFLVNEYAEPRFASPADRPVFLRCSAQGCGGRLPKPAVYGNHVACPLCKRSRPWF